MKCKTSRIGKSVEIESRFVVARGRKGGQWGVTAEPAPVSFWGEENVLELRGGDGCTW